MKREFMRGMMQLGEDPRVCLVVGDLGFATVEEFAETWPKQFLNAGVAEQNMTGLATGMALSGKIVFTYSIANFPTLRCLEQIRNDVCYHNANVKITSIGGGLSYGALGMSHHAVEDLAIMRALPGMTVVAPGDPIEAELATVAVARHDGPCYLRLDRASGVKVHDTEVEFKLGKAIEVRDGSDVALVSTGAMLRNSLDASELLAARGIRARVLSMHTVKPLDEAAILRVAKDVGVLLSIEEHTLIGGLGGAIAELLAGREDVRCRFRRLGLPSTFVTIVGTQEHLRERLGLSASAIANSALELLGCQRKSSGC